jgi:hypothetical protein
MQLYEATNGINAQGNVKSAFVRGAERIPALSRSHRLPMIRFNQCRNDGLDAKGGSHLRAKLWQDKNVITADRLLSMTENTLWAT